jgi:glucose-6-phosphate isomerase
MLRIDYANCLSERVGEHGLDAESLIGDARSARRAAEITEDLAATRGTGWERWRQLPYDPMRRDHLTQIKSLVSTRRDRFDTLLVLGIGGSALGNIALQSALNTPTWNLVPREKRTGPRLLVLDNVDPDFVGAALDLVAESEGGLERTLVNVISKSGETAETAAQFMTFRKALADRLGAREHADHVVAITDPAKGTMRAICDEAGYATLPVPEGVGGRFSVLSPVGLFSAAMCGIDIEALLDGAQSMDQRCAAATLRENPAALLATLLVRLAEEKNKPIHVLMPYANGLYLLADWFRQLWAESLGKNATIEGKPTVAGFTPVKALGATDQHSQIQLYREGPNDKVIGLIEVESFGDRESLRIPEGISVEALAYLEGASFADLLRAEKRATEYALIESARPNFTIRFPTVDAHHVGEFLMLWQVATAYAGRMLNIDAYDQPAVETGKKATFGLMGRRGFESWRETVDKALARTSHVV